MEKLALSADELDDIIEKKINCPFLGSAVRHGTLHVRSTAERPLARVEEVHELGDSGGGNLGWLLAFFARGNHCRVPDVNGAFNQHTPDGLFSLDLPGSQGAHPGHSGILMGDPTLLDTGRLDRTAFERLAALATDGRLTHKAVGRFIADNVHADPNSRRLSLSGVLGRIKDIGGGIIDDIGDFLGIDEDEDAETLEAVAKAMGDDNLLGSSGEFALLFALLENGPDGDENGILLADVEGMFLHKQFPEGWETWPKSARTWLHATLSITFAANSALKGLRDD